MSVQFTREPPPERMELQGTIVDSVEEYNFGIALEKFCFGYYFQWFHWYGTPFPGNIVPDFIVLTKPRPTPVFIDGDYWHSGSKRERDKAFRLQIFATMGGQLAQYVEIDADLLTKPEDAENEVLGLFGSNC